MHEPTRPGEYIKVWRRLVETPFYDDDGWHYWLADGTVVGSPEPIETLHVAALDGEEPNP